jgi:hypothetical protein
MNKELEKIEQKWNNAGVELACSLTAIFLRITRLGRLDISLRSKNHLMKEWLNGGSFEGWDNQWYFSELWVLDAWHTIDFVCNFNSKISDHSKKIPKNLLNKFEKFKAKLVRVRSLIAKQKPARQSDEITGRAYYGTRGIGFVINSKEVFYRDDLADETLRLFEELAAQFPAEISKN